MAQHQTQLGIQMIAIAIIIAQAKTRFPGMSVVLLDWHTIHPLKFVIGRQMFQTAKHDACYCRTIYLLFVNLGQKQSLVTLNACKMMPVKYT